MSTISCHLKNVSLFESFIPTSEICIGPVGDSRSSVESTLPRASICVGQQLQLAAGNVVSTGFNLYSRCKEVQNIFFRDAQGNGWLSVQTDLRAAAVRQSWPANPCLSRPSDSQGELETQQRHHEAKLITTKEEEKHKMDKMALELELKWTETLR